MRVGITGARGFLGERLVDALAGDQRVEGIVAIDIRPVRPSTARVRHVQRDVWDPAVARDLDGTDGLVHLAFRDIGRANSVSPSIDGSRNVFAAAIGAGVSSIIHASSASAYGATPDTPIPLTEQHPLRGLPPFYYPRAKAAVEHVLDELAREHSEARIARLRPVMIVGPGAPMLFAGRAYVTLSDFDPLMQFVWIDDVVRAFVTALHEPAAVGAYNVAAPGPVRASSVARLIGVPSIRLPYRLRHAFAVAALRARVPGAVHPGFIETARYSTVLDTGRIERELGWQAGGDCAAVLRRYGALLRNESGAE